MSKSKSISVDDNIIANPKNKLIVDEFRKLIRQIEYDIDNADSKETSITNMYRLRQIKKALKRIINYKDIILSGEQLKGIPDIGKGTMRRVNEILTTGRLEEIIVSDTDKKYLQFLDDLETVYGIGRKRALELIKKYNIYTVDELRNAVNTGKITVTHDIMLGLKYYDDIRQSIPRQEIMKIDTLLHNVLLKIDPQLYGEICGSYRRLKLVSNDVDILIVHPLIKTEHDLKTKHKYLHIFVSELIKIGFIVDSITASGSVTTKYMGFCKLESSKLVRRIDIRIFPMQSFYTALLYFTGSAEFNKRLRSIAIDNNMLLNEYGLFLMDPSPKRIVVNSEKDIFTALSLEYIEPQYRN